eukprot:GILI01001859.1.p1 GENE.GILI01001859.1~~GILI01001859.1.p1  ORF type:complete len:169 (+),score=54.82 GILI01001859.1:46-507(+)
MFRRIVPSTISANALGLKAFASTPSLFAFQFKSEEQSAKPVTFSEGKEESDDQAADGLKKNHKEKKDQSSSKHEKVAQKGEKKSERREDSPSEPSAAEKEKMLKSGNPFKQARALPSESQVRATHIASDSQLQRDLPSSQEARKMADEAPTKS